MKHGTYSWPGELIDSTPLFFSSLWLTLTYQPDPPWPPSPCRRPTTLPARPPPSKALQSKRPPPRLPFFFCFIICFPAQSTKKLMSTLDFLGFFPCDATGSGSLPRMPQIWAAWSPSTCSRIRNLWFFVFCCLGLNLSDAVYSDEQVGCSREIGHRPGWCGRRCRRRGAPPPQLLAAADDTYLVGSGGWGAVILQLTVHLFFSFDSKPKRNNLHVPSLRVQMVLGGVVYTAVPFYKRARKVEGMFTSLLTTVLLQGAD